MVIGREAKRKQVDRKDLKPMETREVMSVLECSSKGDRRFSAFYAKVAVHGEIASIEEHYQLCKRFGNEVPDSVRSAKGRKPTHFALGGKRYHVKYLSAWYKLLWVKYLDEHPDLVAYASGFGDFSDMFKGRSVNCQADVIHQYVKEGRKSILAELNVKEFVELMRKTEKDSCKRNDVKAVQSRNGGICS
jgi:hypothetical protein